MKTKRTVIVAGSMLLVIYIAISFWIARDVRIFLRSGMDNNTNYSSYMNDQAYDQPHSAEDVIHGLYLSS